MKEAGVNRPSRDRAVVRIRVAYTVEIDDSTLSRLAERAKELGHSCPAEDTPKGRKALASQLLRELGRSEIGRDQEIILDAEETEE